MTTTKTIPTKTFKIRVSQTLVRSEHCYKGPFDTVEELLTVEAYNGDYADVFETDTRWKYNGQTWENTNQPIPIDGRYALEEDVSVVASPNTIAKRDSDGALSVGTPTAAQHATSKEYVDNTDEALSQRIEEHYDETSQNFTELGQALQDETTRATQAEAELSNDITDLKQQIQDETNRAETAEGILADEIDATKTLVQNEQDRATKAEADLDSKIEAEANTRDEADNALDQRINTLSDTVQQNDNKQTANLQAETQRAQTAEQTLQTNIDTKLTRVENVTADDQAYVKNADGSQSMLSIDSNATPNVLVKRDAQGHVKTAAPTSDDDASTKHYVDAAVQAIDEEALALQQALNNEISRAQAAEEILATSIDEEIVRAKAAEQTNATAISEETTRAKAAEEANANAIAAETTRAEQAETNLQDDLNSETQARQSADTTLQTNIDNEVKARQDADTALEQSIEQTKTDVVGDASTNANTLGKLEDLLTAEQTARQSADSSLQSSVSALQSSKLDKSFSTAVLTGCTYVYTSSDDSSKLQFNIVNPSTNTATTLAVNIPKATSSQSGLMPKESVTQLSNLGTRVSALEGKQYRYLYTASTNPTASDINTFVTGQGGTAPFSGVEVIVEGTMHIWRYYQNDNIGWRDDGIDTVNTATQTTLGVVQGSEDDGKVYVESDGTMSLNGYDALVDADEANAQAISSEATARQNADNALTTQLENKLDKITSTASLQRAYVITASGAQSTVNIDSNATANTLALRDSSGRVKTATPSASTDAANKQYVDSISNMLDGEINDANTALQAEVEAREQADAALQSDIDAEVTRAKAAEQTNATAAANAQTTANSKYTKPSTGIPEADLSSGVVEKLNRAIPDDYYVKPATGIPITDLASAVQSTLNSVAGKYVKPSTGIPKSDLAADVQASLELADSALQSVPNASTTVRGVVLLGATGGAARYGQKADVGLGNVNNTSDANKPVSTAQRAAIDTVQSNVDDVAADLTSHTGNKSNPHAVTKTQVGLGNVDNVKQYSASNPPPYPVTSVNNKTGAVTLTKSDIGLSNVANVLQYSVSNPPPYPVTSVAGKTGAVTLVKGDVGLGNVQNVDTTNASNISSGILAIVRIASGLVEGSSPISVSRSSTSGVYTVSVLTRNNTSVGGLGYETTGDRGKPVTLNTIANWNGSYNANSVASNLTYCKSPASSSNADNVIASTAFVRDVVADLVDGLASQTALNAEISARKAADNALREQIDNLGSGTIVKTAAEWASDNTVLEAGQFGYDSTGKITKIGDGIMAWETLPVFVTTSFKFEKASWADIAALSESGSADKYFSVGDEKTISLTTDEQITLVILGFNHDDLTSGGKAGITIGMKNLLATTYRMNASNTNAGGWDESEMRTSTMATLLSQLPSDLQSVIKQVNKKATAGSQSTSITTSADKLWLLAEVEVDGTTSAGYADEGEQYEYWKTVKDGTVAADRIKYLSNGSGSADDWWLRSPIVSNTTPFRNFGSAGGVGSSIASGTRGVSFGFCV